MKRMIQYKVKADASAENERLVKAVFEELGRVRPKGFRYVTVRQDDGVSFVHVATYDEGVDSSVLTTLPSFKAFVAGIRERCETLPATTELQEIGSYGFAGS
ncbi:hypothetical protein QTI66_02625 [Variovorax sp. J22R133]|uniref:hypothetical protein n=1 Tax=Variovorax brevis TaxID=3053503 RepID=UPI0025766F02|nr:hypothetical protein [Variovorax sp. J22R133]MDM0111022.1 hypothetical protein [Variovorax sp. J22R133]